MADNWHEYQEEAAQLFRSMGLEADTNVTMYGVRTQHDIDVVVRSRHVGFDITWLVECKHWKDPVNKLHVLGLRQIVTDLGADRGILLCEVGFQSGALEAAKLTNVQLTDLKNVGSTAGSDITAMRLRDLYDRAEHCRERYWNIPKDLRIRYGLRCDVTEWGYSGDVALRFCHQLFTPAFRGVYPFKAEGIEVYAEYGQAKQFDSPKEVLAAVEPKLIELEQQFLEAEKRAAADGRPGSV